MTAAKSHADRTDPNDMALRSRIGAYCLHATHDPRTATARARAAFLSRFQTEVDPNGVLGPRERKRRAMASRRASFARLAMQSAHAPRHRLGSALGRDVE